MYDCCIKKDKRKNKQTNKKQRKNATTTTATRNSDLWVASVLLLTSTLSVFHITSFVFERVIAQNHSTTLIPIHPEELAAQFAKWRCSPMFFFCCCFFFCFFFFLTTGVTTATMLSTFHKPKQSHESQRIPVQTLASPQSEISITTAFEKGGRGMPHISASELQRSGSVHLS